MKYFNTEEKDILRYLVNKKKQGSPIFVYDILDKICSSTDSYLEIKISLKEVKLFLSRVSIDMQFIDMLQNKMVVIINLINYLEKNGYITLFNAANVMDEPIYIAKIERNNYIPYDFPDKITNDLICSYVAKQIIVTQDLIEYVNDDFVTAEEKRHNDILCATWVGIGVSIFSSIISIL